MRLPPWTFDDIPDLRGRKVVITGANTGLGFEVSSALARKGAHVVLACRSMPRAAAALDALGRLAPDAEFSVVELDLGSLESVHQAARQITEEHPSIDILVNNAGTLGTRERTETPDGLEATFAANHLGTFAFTGLLLDRLLPVEGSRIVTMSSISTANAEIDLSDLLTTKGYRRSSVYSRSKLANLMFAFELHHRLEAAGARTASLAAHPGQSRTEFTRDLNPIGRFIYGNRARPLTKLVMQDKEIGMLAAARAATDPTAQSGDYYGPSGWLELTGHPVKVGSNQQSKYRAAQRELWRSSEDLTGITYPLPR